MFILVACLYFLIRFIVGVVLRRRVDPQKFFQLGNQIYGISSLILGALLLFSLGGRGSLLETAVGFMLLADSFFSILALLRLNNQAK